MALAGRFDGSPELGDFGNQFFALQRLRSTKIANCAQLSPLLVASERIRLPLASAIF